MSFNGAEARVFYRLLHHRPLEYTELRAYNPQTKQMVKVEFVQNEEHFIKICREWSGKYQVYAGLNPRKQKSGTNEDVPRRTLILIDIDRHTGDGGATDEELKDAENDTLKVVDYLIQNGHPEPYVDMSGNGYHIIPIIDLASDATTTDRIKEFYKTLPADTDPKNADLARLCKVTGTLSLRGPPRLSFLLSPGKMKQDKTLETYLTTVPQNTEASAPTIKPILTEKGEKGESPKRIRNYINKMRPCIRLMLQNMNPGAKSPSGHLDHEAHLLIVKDAQYHGLGYNEIVALFSSQPDYNKTITEKAVAAAATDNLKKGITPWYCSNLIERGWCTAEDPDVCLAVQHDPTVPRKKKKKPTTDKGAELIKLAKANAIEFFRDQYQTGYATIPINDAMTHVTDDFKRVRRDFPNNTDLGVSKECVNCVIASFKKTVPINSRVFKWWIARLYHEKTKETTSNETIRSASLVLEAETQVQPMRFLYNRLAPNGDLSYWWDMGDDLGRAIHINKDGWRIETDPPSIFRRYPHTLPIPDPERGGNLEPFLDYLNLDDPGDKLLAITAAISYLVPEVPHIGTTIIGRQGSGKSTLHRLFQNLIDPSSADLLTLPTKADDLVQVAEHHYLATFDNVGWLTTTQSDILCRAITGAGNEKRELYTTDESFIRQFIRCIGINGISVPIEKSDLFSRMLLLPWTPIKTGERRTDAEMKAQILSDSPKLIGAMLSTLVKAIQLYPDIKPELDARMADYVKWGIAITKAIGLEQCDFENAYAANLATQDEEVVKSSMVAEQFISYMEQTNKVVVEGTATKLKTDIEAWVNPLDDYGRPIGDLLSKKTGWPKTAKDFSIQLTEVAPALESLGYIVSVSRTSKARGLRVEKRVPLDSKDAGQKTFDLSKPELTEERLRAALKEAPQ